MATYNNKHIALCRNITSMCMFIMVVMIECNFFDTSTVGYYT